MKQKINSSFLVSRVTAAVLFILYVGQGAAVDFNTDVLDAADRSNVDFSRFSSAGYVMPGKYQMQVMVNDQPISPSAMTVDVIEQPASGESQPLPKACLTAEIVDKMGLIPTAREKIILWNKGLCADFSALKGTEIRTDIASGVLHVNMPQAWLEYIDATWLPPSRWENGISGLLFDYNLNGNASKPTHGDQTQSLSYHGTVGANASVWRLRADYQGNLKHTTGSDYGTTSEFDWRRFYMYRAIPSLQSKLTVGENYINSAIFDTWRYTGASLESDDRMLPPKLRGYAPQISGVADTNARVVISQQGRILYDSTVPAGPFTIQDIDSSVRGTLDVEIIEQNGLKKTFQVTTAYVPYLTRPGQIRYKLVSGRSLSPQRHETEGPGFAGGEISWGLTNSWSLYGGATIAGDYNALALGVGHDMNKFGTLSLDLTQSASSLGGRYGTLKGKSWRASYSKRFDEVDTDINFAGYRFSEKDYMTMQQYLDARYRDDFRNRNKELYTSSLNKNFPDLNMSVSLQYSYQTFWDRPADNYYTLSVNRYFDALGFRNISGGLTASRSTFDGAPNNSLFLRLSVPWGAGKASYSGNLSNHRYSQSVGYSDTFNNGLDSYNLNAGLNTGGKNQDDGGQFNAYYSHTSPLVNVSVNASSVQSQYSQVGMSLSGGATITAKGAALHAGGGNGGTRLLVDTDGIADVPVNGGRVSTNRWGIGVVTDMSSYYRSTTSVDLNRLPDDMEATGSVAESVLTEGAIGYRMFDVLKGARLFAVLRLADGSHPPFGASVTNSKGRELGMVGDSGLVWLSGVVPGESLNVSWDARAQCALAMPQHVTTEQQLLLPCHSAKAAQ
ncbi:MULTISPECIES: fimbria/pilus outer membrane usher protein [Enterobacteriaceae]|uniref:fimbria/pilus outer membrane usher protein n=1 Tax=Enterobacteriaceae TaxID=543 RepID=UPI0018897A73|nr:MULTISPECIES: fimbria/pilus outer membrane usher protein [Enterobacteriaceae]MBF2792902.1 fimbria/pilus outer membrane usher protein [Enterobacter asburiae]MDX7584489.1 fimbria/pilus outer membrane usher protein [Klebsiella pneumoniae]CAH8250641.1 Outer membrane usher protein PapC [Enterobacter mori]